MRRNRLWTIAVVGVLSGFSICAAADTDDLIKTIKAVGGKGQGHTAAIAALKELQTSDASALPTIVEAFDGTGPLSSNWLRSAFESIADRAIKSGKTLPSEQLEKLVKDTNQNARARRLAYEWLLRVDKTIEDRLIPGMLEDPSSEFRRDAVSRLLAQAKGESGDDAKPTYQKALRGAVHDDQVKQIVAALKKLGEEVDLQAHFGFVPNWQIAGPFDNKDKKGFPVEYPPEKSVDTQATYKGQLGDVKWQTVATDDSYGIVDIAKAIENYKGSAMYAFTTVNSPELQQVQFRLGTPNAWKLWVNGKLIFAREEYHRGTRMDQYRVSVPLKQGENSILLKICQNEQEDDWAQKYQFQLRICNDAGSAVPVK